MKYILLITIIAALGCKPTENNIVIFNEYRNAVDGIRDYSAYNSIYNTLGKLDTVFGVELHLYSMIGGGPNKCYNTIFLIESSKDNLKYTNIVNAFANHRVSTYFSIFSMMHAILFVDSIPDYAFTAGQLDNQIVGNVALPDTFKGKLYKINNIEYFYAYEIGVIVNEVIGNQNLFEYYNPLAKHEFIGKEDSIWLQFNYVDILYRKPILMDTFMNIELSKYNNLNSCYFDTQN